jgi:hypothetical protein
MATPPRATPPRPPRPPTPKPNRPSYGDALADEALRQARVRFFRKVPFLYEASNVYYRMKSGAMTNPRYVVGAVVSLVVVSGGAILSCLGVVGAFVSGLLNF